LVVIGDGLVGELIELRAVVLSLSGLLGLELKGLIEQLSAS
jgi:hypothetical protein